MSAENEREEVAHEAGRAAPASSSILDIIDVTGDTVIEIGADTAREVAGIVGGATGGGEMSVEQKAEYYAKCVDDPERYPPLNEEMESMAQRRRQYEEASQSLRGGEASPEAKAWNYEDRKEEYMAYEKSYSL